MTLAEKRAEERGERKMIQTQHKTFDTEANHPESGYIGRGNVISGVQWSGFIRPRTATECNGFTRPPGHLRDFDLDGLPRNTPRFVRAAILANTETEQVCVYKFRHMARGREIVHGWLIVGSDNRKIAAFCTGPTWKSLSVLATCAAVVGADQ